MKKILLILLVWWLFLFSLNKISTFYLPNKTDYEIYHKGITLFKQSMFMPWLNFDGRNYLHIVIKGYTPILIANATHTNWVAVDTRVFFPMYPLLIRLLSLNLILNPILIGLAVSYIAIGIGLIVFYRYVQKRYDKNIAWKSFIALLVFPTSYYLLSYYTESIYFLISISVFWFLRKKNYGWASVLTAVATATRVVGLALIPSLLYEAYHHYKKTKQIAWPILISPIGIFAYMVYTWIASGNPLSIILHQQDWNKSFGLLSPVSAFYHWTMKVVSGPGPQYDTPFAYPIIIVELLTAVLFVAFLIVSWRKLPISYWLYSLFFALTIFFTGSFASIHRYLLLVFPLYIYMAQYLPQKIFYFVCTISFLLLVCFASLYLRGYWVA